MISWAEKREQARVTTKEKIAVLKHAFPDASREFYRLINRKINHAVCGVDKETMSENLGITKKTWSQRDYFTETQLDLLCLLENSIKNVLAKADNEEEVIEQIEELCSMMTQRKLLDGSVALPTCIHPKINNYGFVNISK